MTDIFAKWNLRPSERRLVVAVGVVLFIVINLVWVRPHFSDWSTTSTRLSDARWKIQTYEREIAKLPTYEAQVRSLEGEGASVPLEDMAVHFARTVQLQASQSRISILSSSRATVRTNQFFIEQIQNFTVQAEEKNLVDFLYNLGSGTSTIRVRDLSVHPDASRQLLSANIRLAASYRKNTAVAATVSPEANAPKSTSSAVAQTSAPAAAKPAVSQPVARTNQSKPTIVPVVPIKK